MAVMPDSNVQRLLRQAVQDSDASGMREALDLLLGGGASALSPEAEFEVRHPEYVMEMPQSGERIRGRDAMRAMQEAFPAPPPSVSIRRVVGAGRTWVVEGVNDYGDDRWHVVLILELDDAGHIVTDTRYYAKPFDPPEWRAAWTERI
jgi:hypothetical protein